MKKGDEHISFEQQTTRDGSLTAVSALFGETYHSLFGAETESRYVYLEQGLFLLREPNPVILEMGFGTGLNALLTLEFAERTGRSIRYVTYEKYPVPPDVLMHMPRSAPDERSAKWFRRLHEAVWNEETRISPSFQLCKMQADIITMDAHSCFDLVYYDAFSPKTQPELWTAEIFSRIFEAMKPGGILVTYSSSGHVKRALRTAGFQLERLQGPPGKKHMLRARKA